MSKDQFTGLPDELMDLIDEADKSFSVIEIKTEKRKYGKLWATISGIDADPDRLKDIMKVIKNKLACGGTLKGRIIEVLYGKHDRTDELIEVLVKEGFNRDSIHVSSGK